MTTTTRSYTDPNTGLTIPNAYFVLNRVELRQKDSTIIHFDIYASEQDYTDGKTPVGKWHRNVNALEAEASRFNSSNLSKDGVEPRSQSLELLNSELDTPVRDGAVLRERAL